MRQGHQDYGDKYYFLLLDVRNLAHWSFEVIWRHYKNVLTAEILDTCLVLIASYIENISVMQTSIAMLLRFRVEYNCTVKTAPSCGSRRKQAAVAPHLFHLPDAGILISQMAESLQL